MAMAKNSQGTGGFYFHENFDKNGDPSEKVLLVTNHHVLCKRDDKKYDLRTHNLRRQKVRLCGLDRFQRGFDTLDSEVVAHGIQASTLVEEIGSLNIKVAKGNEDATDELKEALAELNKHRVAIVELEKFHNDVSSTWSSISHRGIGVLDYTPALSIDVDHDRYTQDWATIRLARFKPNFMGNIIYLGKISTSDFARVMNARADTKPAVKYPEGGLLRIKGFLTKEQLANPQSDGDPSLHVLKDGCTSQLAFGRCAGLESYTRSEDGVRRDL